MPFLSGAKAVRSPTPRGSSVPRIPKGIPDPPPILSFTKSTSGSFIVDLIASSTDLIPSLASLFITKGGKIKSRASSGAKAISLISSGVNFSPSDNFLKACLCPPKIN